MVTTCSAGALVALCFEIRACYYAQMFYTPLAHPLLSRCAFVLGHESYLIGLSCCEWEVGVLIMVVWSTTGRRTRGREQGWVSVCV